MQELDKILEEMQEVKEIMLSPQNIDCFGDPCKENDCCACVINKCMEIVKKHMNDGWIPVEEALPKDSLKIDPVIDENGAYVDADVTVYLLCPNCGEMVGIDENVNKFCHECGQAIDTEDLEE